MKYQIDWSEQKTTSTGKKMLKATLKEMEVPNLIHEDVAIWDSFPGFDGLMTGHIVEGDIVSKQNGQYVNKSLYAPKVAATGQNRASGAISKAQDKKSEMIKTAQENKELGIMTSSTIRMAVDIALAELPIPHPAGGSGNGSFFDVGTFKGRVNFWREWLVSNWSLPEDK